MYDALARERFQMERDDLRRRLEAAARLPRKWEMDEPTTARRRRWPRARRHAAVGC